jgi:Tfp pilus assembly major pilin PilA
MPASVRKQKGLTMISWMVIIAIGVFFTLIGIKMVPVYLENYSIKQVLGSLQDDHRVRDMGRSEIKKIIIKRLKINRVYSFPQDKINIKASNKSIEISLDYEVRKPVIGNVSVLMAFSESVEIRK